MIAVNYNNMKLLAMNPHFYALLIQGFLSGYGSPCEIKFAFIAITILINADTRKPLKTANRNSRFETLYSSGRTFYEESVSGKALFAGFAVQYHTISPYVRKAIIILCSEGKASLSGNTLVCSSSVDFHDYAEPTKAWIRSAFYLGKVMQKSSKATISLYCGVEL